MSQFFFQTCYNVLKVLSNFLVVQEGEKYVKQENFVSKKKKENMFNSL